MALTTSKSVPFEFSCFFVLEMVPVILLFLLATTSSTPDGQLLPISSATAKTFHLTNPPVLAIDGDTSTFYHSKTTGPPEWLKLKLEKPALVSRVVIVNR